MGAVEGKAAVIKQYTRKLLNDQKKHSRKEIINYIKQESGRSDFSGGNFSGALNELTKEPGYVNIERGWYVYNGPLDNREPVDPGTSQESVDSNMTRVMESILKRTIENIEDEIGRMNVLSFSEKDFEKLSEVKKTIENIQIEIDKWS